MTDAVWVFDGTEGHCAIMSALVSRHIQSLERVEPGEFSDPLQRLAAESDSHADEALRDDPLLARLFPPALDDEEQAKTFRRDALAGQVRNRLEAARKVLAAVSSVDDCTVHVPMEDIDAWVMTMSALRAQWHAELTGSGDRLAQARHRDMLRNPTAAAIADWLAYQIECALDARSRAEDRS